MRRRSRQAKTEGHKERRKYCSRQRHGHKDPPRHLPCRQSNSCPYPKSQIKSLSSSSIHILTGAKGVIVCSPDERISPNDLLRSIRPGYKGCYVNIFLQESSWKPYQVLDCCDSVKGYAGGKSIRWSPFVHTGQAITQRNCEIEIEPTRRLRLSVARRCFGLS